MLSLTRPSLVEYSITNSLPTLGTFVNESSKLLHSLLTNQMLLPTNFSLKITKRYQTEFVSSHSKVIITSNKNSIVQNVDISQTMADQGGSILFP